MTKWPDWWNGELEFSPHLLKQMIDRGFTETDLRTMMAAAVSLRRTTDPGRWVVEAPYQSRSWHVIVEPDTIYELVVVSRRSP